MSSFNKDELMSPNVPSSSNVQSSEYGISPMTTLSVNLSTGLHIRRTLSFHSTDVSPKKSDLPDASTGVLAPSNSPNRMPKHAKSNSANGSPSTGTRSSLSRRSSHASNLKIPADKENSSSLRSYSMEYPLTGDEEISPSKFTIARSIRERYPLEDQDPNSQDSGYSNASSSYSEDSKSSSNFRFAEPNGVPPRRMNAVEFSPGREMSPLSKKSISPRYRKQIFHSMSTDSMSSDFSDDGFGENLALPSVGLLLMEQDENAQLPAGFNTLLSGQIFNLNKITDSLAPSESSLLQTSLRRSLTENLTPNRTFVRSSVESEFSELLILEKEATKRTAQDEESGPFLKRRKPNKLVTPNEKLIPAPGPATAPPTSTSIRGTLFSYGFKKTSVKFQRSFSESEATIDSALQKATTNPNLIGDFSKAFALPLKKGKHTDLKNIDCHTLAKLINGGYDDKILSFTIIDCRYPYEYNGGHIKGAINLYTKDQMMEELKEKKYLQQIEDGAASESKRNILIFHCEFSSERGPSLSRYLRNADREKNSLQYPKLDYPEIYLLDGGYSNFFKHHKDLCDPCNYRPMNDPNHSAELRAFKARSKSLSCIGDKRKLHNTYFKRLGL